MRKRPLAYADLADIWSYIADDSEQQADLFLDMLDVRLALLATQPEMGRERPELAPRLRAFPVKRYVVFYRPMRDGIEVLRVLHSARDVTRAKFGVSRG
ncbi:type II toxin-antitoxin system RelE/ParE family toxin [Pseudorhodoferax sp. Leaf267]|uniref:type II toxin-antitoxin system RelE/ParE family toxin n=1 Tax=Pseudorhodoferax sp. Leaf267 TaxID=1736316 RepID=UPI001F44D598|nr:type II toxin-antitoxin system RelE/ParE family toxin [Pseudorhodoferax sp. Leaf267]